VVGLLWNVVHCEGVDSILTGSILVSIVALFSNELFIDLHLMHGVARSFFGDMSLLIHFLKLKLLNYG
jgi:hypothetical protein